MKRRINQLTISTVYLYNLYLFIISLVLNVISDSRACYRVTLVFRYLQTLSDVYISTHNLDCITYDHI